MKNIVIFFIIWNGLILINKLRKIERIKRIRNFNLGSSHSYFAFKCESSVTNLAMPSQTLYYDYLVLKRYFDILEENGVCYIGLSYFSFSSGKLWQNEDIRNYFYKLKLKDFEKKDKIRYIISRYFPIIESVLKKLKKLRKNSKINIKSVNRIKKHNEFLINEKNRKFNLINLEEIIKLCLKKKINVILFTTPFTKFYNSFFTLNDLEKYFYTDIKILQKKYNIGYIDLSHNEIFYKDEDKYFDDYDHLSELGAKKFLEVLREKENEI